MMQNPNFITGAPHFILAALSEAPPRSAETTAALGGGGITMGGTVSFGIIGPRVVLRHNLHRSEVYLKGSPLVTDDHIHRSRLTPSDRSYTTYNVGRTATIRRRTHTKDTKGGPVKHDYRGIVKVSVS